MKVEEMFVLMDGTQADPNDVSRGEDGVWRHKNGVKVAMNADGRPETVGDRAALNGRKADRDHHRETDRHRHEASRHRHDHQHRGEAGTSEPKDPQSGSAEEQKPTDPANDPAKDNQPTEKPPGEAA